VGNLYAVRDESRHLSELIFEASVVLERQIRLSVNGHSTSVVTDDERPLLDVLREELGLTGTKYGCGEGECGACTVLIDGQAVRSCITTIGEAGDQAIQTIEGLATDGRLHPLQVAFVEQHAVQCGYCVPGQIMQAAALLREHPNPTREQIVGAMNGNICRCCNYVNILAAVERAAQLTRATGVRATPGTAREGLATSRRGLGR
jgi:aerobic-type carbon monoxide dehydrogenase small subunit (CoxS/CutS family)